MGACSCGNPLAVGTARCSRHTGKPIMGSSCFPADPSQMNSFLHENSKKWVLSNMLCSKSQTDHFHRQLFIPQYITFWSAPVPIPLQGKTLNLFELILLLILTCPRPPAPSQADLSPCPSVIYGLPPLLYLYFLIVHATAHIYCPHKSGETSILHTWTLEVSSM